MKIHAYLVERPRNSRNSPKLQKLATLVKGLALLLTAILITGCGTLLSRTGNTSFGAYPYQAVVGDAVLVAVEEPDVKALAFVSIPLDLVLDTLFLPPDLIYWVAGKKKDGLLSM